MSKTSLKKSKVDILRLKVLLVDKEDAENELDQGTRDLTHVLKEFKKNIDHDQKEVYDNFFFGSFKPPAQVKESSMNNNEIVVFDASNTTKKTNVSKPDWIKQTYKKIVQRTHPDRYVNFPIEEIKNKFIDIYRKAVEAFNENNIGILLLCAYETEVVVDSNLAQAHIHKSINDYKQRIDQISTLVGYQWYHVPEKDRQTCLENYLKSLGYKFSIEKVKSVLEKRKPLKRNIGKRPEKLRVNKRKIK